MVSFEKVINVFKRLSAVPRESGNCTGIGDYLISFGKRIGAETYRDEAGNVLLTLKGNSGNSAFDNTGLVFQMHMDMVCVKRESSSHDFTKDPIEVVLYDQHIKAKDTSLGADNGMAIAMVMSFMEDKDIVRPMIQALFTVDEESTMYGIKHFDVSLLKSKYIVNLDEEADDFITVGSAGIIDMRMSFDKRKFQNDLTLEKNQSVMQITISNLMGGHSGIDIDKRRTNAALLLYDYMLLLKKSLYRAKYDCDTCQKALCDYLTCEKKKENDFKILSVSSGTHMNSIPATAQITFTCNSADESKLQNEVETLTKDLIKNNQTTDIYRVNVQLNKVDGGYTRFYTEELYNIYANMYTAVKSGVVEYDERNHTQVLSSMNFARVYEHGNELQFWVSMRSSDDRKLIDMKEYLMRFAEQIDNVPEVKTFEKAWMRNTDSILLPYAQECYRKVLGVVPMSRVIHAGLECGTLSRKIPGSDIIAIGPNIINPHTVNEMVEVASVKRIIAFISALLSDWSLE